MVFKIVILSFILLFLPLIKVEAAERKLENYYFQISFYTHHYSQRDYQNNQQRLIGIERHYSDQSLNGLTHFVNTYGQETVYVYGGKNYNLFSIGKTDITAKFTLGIVHGYLDEGEEYDSWMHQMETFPAIVFGVGIRREPFRIDFIPFADAGIIIIGGIEF